MTEKSSRYHSEELGKAVGQIWALREGNEMSELMDGSGECGGFIWGDFDDECQDIALDFGYLDLEEMRQDVIDRTSELWMFKNFGI